MEDAREFAVADPGGGGGAGGPMLAPFLLFFLFTIAKFTSKNLVLNK